MNENKNENFENSLAIGCGVGGAKIGRDVSYVLIETLQHSLCADIPTPVRMVIFGTVVMTGVAAGLFAGKSVGSVINDYFEKQEV